MYPSKKNIYVTGDYTLESKEGSRQAHQKVFLAYTCKGRIFPFCKQNLLANYVVTRVWLPARFGRRVWVRNRFVRRIWLAESCFCNPSLVARPLEAVRSTPHPFCRHCWVRTPFCSLKTGCITSPICPLPFPLLSFPYQLLFQRTPTFRSFTLPSQV